MSSDSKKLLVADDSLTIQKVIRLALSNEGYEIQAVSDCDDALEQIALFQPQVVLIDVSLPKKSAFEVKAKINEIEDAKDVRFVLMSSAFEQVDEKKASEVGFDGRLIKPFDPGHLRKVLSTVLSKQPSRKVDSEKSEQAPGFSESTFSSEEEEIRKLSESTIDLTEIDDYQWSLNEKALKDNTVTTEVTGSSSDGIQAEDPSLPPPRSLFEQDGMTLKENLPEHTPSDAATAYHNAPSDFDSSHHEEPVEEKIEAHSPKTIPITQGEVESIIAKQIEGSVERMMKKVIPEIAEKVIKKEIDRLLSNPPPQG